MNPEGKDEFLEARLAKTDRFLQEGRIPTSSKVIPLAESLCALQWVLPSQQAAEILRNMRTFALGDCFCRERYRRCDHPLTVCIRTNDAADKWVAEGKARRITLDEARDRLKLAHEHGLVHITYYNPEQHIYALCSCCACCCQELQLMKKYARPDLVAHADYVAVVDRARCVGCGACAGRCVFGAQEQAGATVVFHRDKCYGCGLCVTTCPAGAITMQLRRNPANNRR